MLHRLGRKIPFFGRNYWKSECSILLLDKKVINDVSLEAT